MPEYTEKLFLGPCDFFWASSSPENLPEAGLQEIAFAGRSNVGKSSLINALLNRKALARTSSTPGRTQELIFFNLGDHLTIVDMPGYGYAKVSKTKKESWDILIRSYLRGRTTLRCAFILVDARHGLKDIDRELMKQMDGAAVSYRIILTKADKAGNLKQTVEAMETELKKHPAAYPSILITSAEEKKGLDDLRAFIISFLEQ